MIIFRILLGKDVQEVGSRERDRVNESIRPSVSLICVPLDITLSLVWKRLLFLVAKCQIVYALRD